MQEYIIGKLGFILPKYTGQLSRKREFTPEAIEHWRSHLDLNDLEKSCKALYVTLLDSHQAKLSPEVRFEILNLLRPTVSYLSQSLFKLCPEGKGIITDNYRSIFDLAQQLNMQMYHGYKLILEQTGKSIFSHRELTFESLFSCMHICSKLIFEAHYHYRKPARFLWKELHMLYQLCHKKKVHRRSLSKLVHWSSRFNTLEDTYKHILLFSISQPNHHTPETLEKLKYAIENWAPLVQFDSLKSKARQPYLVASALDRGPLYVKKGDSPNHQGFSLNLNKLIEHLKTLHAHLVHPSKRQNESAFSGAELALNADFVEILTQLWVNRSERGNQRLKVQGSVTVCLGISAIHWMISKEAPHVDELELTQDDTDTEVIDLGASFLPEQSGSSKDTYFDSYDCELIDESEGGACLKWLDSIPKNLCCGELLGIKKTTNGKTHWWVGNIRWLKENENKQIIFGVQYLSKAAFASKSWLMDASQKQAVCTLLIPENDSDDRPMTVITPSIPFKLGNEVQMQYYSKTFHASLQKNFSTSKNYQQYALEFFEVAPSLPMTVASAQSDQYSA